MGGRKRVGSSAVRFRKGPKCPNLGYAGVLRRNRNSGFGQIPFTCLSASTLRVLSQACHGRIWSPGSSLKCCGLLVGSLRVGASVRESVVTSPAKGPSIRGLLRLG